MHDVVHAQTIALHDVDNVQVVECAARERRIVIIVGAGGSSGVHGAVLVGPDGSYWEPEGTYSEEATVASLPKEVTDDVLGRHL